MPTTALAPGRTRSRRTSRRRAITVTFAVVASLVLSTLPGGPGLRIANAAGDLTSVSDVPSTTPANLGALDLTSLQYGDPTDGVDLVQPPEPDATGAASLGYDLVLPPGRGGVAPDLTLGYTSGDDTSWLGTGWDLSVGAISVDAAFGAPRYLATQESETYQLDGDRLFPNAIRSNLVARTGSVKANFVRTVDTAHEQIIRYGATPSTYCWQVRDTKGNERWYGGEPGATSGTCTRHDDAVLTAPATGVDGGVAGDYYWGLAFTTDISGNTVRYSYEKITGVGFGQKAQANFGVSLYLSSIVYSGFRFDTAPDHPAYRVRFLRDAGVSPIPAARRDVAVDASSGQPVVTRDLLRRVEVEYLSPQHYATGAVPTFVKGWNLGYTNGPFDKALLTSVGQVGADGVELAHHTFSWYDDVRDSAGRYAGFGATEQWGPGAPGNTANIAATSALGTSYRGGADGGAYIGFNPLIASKIGSLGGSFNIGGGQTNEESTLVDLDGDGLPDKVFLEGSTVYYQRNLRRPGTTDADKSAGSWFAPKQSLTGIDSLGRSSDLKIQLHFEAYPVVAIQVGGGFGFSFGDRYFADVNADGRVDFVKPGSQGAHTVYYNVLGNDGVPRFVDSTYADTLEVPLDAFVPSATQTLPPDIEKLLTDNSPRVDTVRRWVAPFDGDVRVTAPVSLTTGTSYAGDGARVTVEHDGAIDWSATLTAAHPSDDPGSLVLHGLTAGEPVYFRLDVINNASGDEVAWSPSLAYVDGTGTAVSSPADAQGRSQSVFSAAQDFTLFGRPLAQTAVPNTTGSPFHATLTVTVTPTAPLTDNLTVLAYRGRTGASLPSVQEVGTTVVPQRTSSAVTASFDVVIQPDQDLLGPDGLRGTDDDRHAQDWVSLAVVSDSPVDTTKFSVTAGLTDPTATGTPLSADEQARLAAAGVSIPDSLPVIPGVRVFSRSSSTSPYTPVTPTHSGSATLTLGVDAAGLQGDQGKSFPAVATVKTADDQGRVGVVARKTMSLTQTLGRLAIAVPQNDASADKVSFTATAGQRYWLELNILNSFVAARVAPTLTSSLAVQYTTTTSKTDTSTGVAQANWPDTDGVFPSGNRGWGIAGYNADSAGSSPTLPIDSSHFDLTQGGSYDENTTVPDAANAPSVTDVTSGTTAVIPSAFPYIPWGPSSGGMADRWRSGGKDTLYGNGATMQSDRLGADVPIPTAAPTGGRTAPQMLNVNGDFNFMVGLVASFTAAAGGGRDLADFEDYNGDGFPDYRSGGTVDYTGPRGAKAATRNVGENSFDLSLGLGGGLDGSALSIGSKKSAGKAGSTSTKTSRGMKLGAGVSVSAEWTNPIDGASAEISDTKSGSDKRDIQGAVADSQGSIPTVAGSTGTIMDRSLIDLNGDGLPDRVDTYSSGELWVALNLGYRFANTQIQWSTGRGHSAKSLNGTLSLGFQFDAMEFAGGVSYTEGVDFTLLDWIDVDGDGVPDRMNNVGGVNPQTVFGSGDGMKGRPEITYGNYQHGNVAVDAAKWGDQSADGNLPGVPLPGGQLDVGRTTALSGGVDFSFYIGPLCVIGICYLVINPGVHGGYDRTTSQVSMVDVDGDGYVDAVRSTDSKDLQVRLNTHRRTNLLKSVANPLGGTFTLDYTRTGNTRANPQSTYALTSVSVDDGHPGDGVSVMTSTYTYSGGVFDRALRQDLGFSAVRQDDLDANGTVLRSYLRSYANSDPYSAGQLTQETTLDGAGTTVARATYAYELADANPRASSFGAKVADVPATGAQLSEVPAVGSTNRVTLFDRALWPRLASETATRFDAAGHPQGLRTDYGYDALGDVISVKEFNETETPYDDVLTRITYSDCSVRSGDRSYGADSSWVSVAQSVQQYGGFDEAGGLLRHREAGPNLCINAAPTRVAELIEPASANDCHLDLYAITEMGFDTHGSYNTVARPSNSRPTSCADYPAPTVADASYSPVNDCSDIAPPAGSPATRYCVHYIFDPHRFTDIAQVTDNHGLTSSATYDPLNGLIGSGTDQNGNLTTYAYDTIGRRASVTAPKEQGTGHPTVSYRYGGLRTQPDAAGISFAWAVADHTDVVRPSDPIQTVAFVDGIGRTVQRKSDASVAGRAGASRVVEGAVDYDALGREANKYYPLVEAGSAATLTTYNSLTSSSPTADTNVPVTKPTVRTFDALDRLRTTTLPDGTTESTDYDHAVVPDPTFAYGPSSGPPVVLTRQIDTDALGHQTRTWADVGGAVYRNEQAPAAASNPDGTAGPLASLPPSGVATTARLVASTSTPGLIVTRFEYNYLGRVVAAVDPAGARTTYSYDLLGDLTSTNSPDAGVVDKQFAPAGNLLTVTRSGGTVAGYGYDLDRLTSIDYTDATPAVRYSYGNPGATGNSAGRVRSVHDGAMDRTYTYDADGNVVTEAATEAADPFGKGSGGTPPNATTGWTFDSLGRVLTTSYPSKEVLTTHYDLGGRPDKLVSAIPQSTLYDQYGTPVPRPDLALTYVSSVGYDEFGQGARITTGTGVVTSYGFDPKRRFLTSIDTDSTVALQQDGSTSAAAQLQRLRYTYDSVGNVRDVVNKLYDRGSATSVSQLGTPPANGLPGASQQSYTYDGFYRVTGAVGSYTDRNTRRNYTFADDYSANGNLVAKKQVTTTTLTTGTTGTKNTGGKTATTSGGSSALSNCNANTSSGGGAMNDDSLASFAIAAGDVTYRKDTAGHTIHQMQKLAARDYTYDAKGNLASWSEPCSKSKTIGRQMTWDAENRLVRIAEGNNDTQYRYSAEGVRSIERGPGGTSWFVNDYWRMVNGGLRYASIYLGGRLIASHRTSGDDIAAPPPATCTDTVLSPCVCTSACSVPDASYCVGDQIYDAATSTCQPRPTVPGKIYFLHKDLQGSLRVVTDEKAGVFQYVDYLPTGRPWVLGQSTIKDTPNLFAGGWTDATYDLVNFGQRWYETREQQFYSPEPMLEEDPLITVANPDLLSAYTYASSNPLRYVDTDGRFKSPADVASSFVSSFSGLDRGKGQNRPKAKLWFAGKAGFEELKDGNNGAFPDAKDKVDRYTTLLGIETVDGVTKVRLAGFTVSKRGGSDPAAATAPQTSPSQPGVQAAAADTTAPTSQAPSRTSLSGTAASPTAATQGSLGSTAGQAAVAENGSPGVVKTTSAAEASAGGATAGDSPPPRRASVGSAAQGLEDTDP